MLRLTEEVAAKIAERVRAWEPERELEGLSYADVKDGTSEKAKKLQEKNGTFDVIISTESVDRAGEIVRQDGWDLKNYKNNPVVLWGHDYYSLGVGVCLDLYNTTYRGVPALGARGVFYSADINPLAQQVRAMYDFGIKMGVGAGCTTSVGFIPKEFDPKDQNVITRAELLEFSFVPVPAQQDVGPAAGRAITVAEANELGLDVFALRAKGMEFAEKAPEVSEKGGEVGDACEMDDGTPGELMTDPNDPDGALVCLPTGKAVTDAGDEPNDNPAAKKLTKAVMGEQSRHAKAIAKCFKAFGEKMDAMPKPEDGDTEEQKSRKADGAGRLVKELKGAIADEHDLHRAKNVAAFRAYEPDETEQKDFDNEAHLKALKAEHDDYEAKCGASFKEFAEKMKGEEDGEATDHADWITKEFQHHGDNHTLGVVKCAKAMCEAFGEGEEAEEKTLKGMIEDAVSEQLAEQQEWNAKWQKLNPILDIFDAFISAYFSDGVKAADLDALVKELVDMLQGHTKGALADRVKAGPHLVFRSSVRIVLIEEKGGQRASGGDDFTKFVDARDLARSLTGHLHKFLAESNEGLKNYHHREK